ncbi:MAG: DUF3750 domain-containing protein [Granulosicoccus sp.]
MKSSVRTLLKLITIVVLLFIVPVGCMVVAHYSSDNAGAHGFGRHGSTRQAPDANRDEAVIQVYAARAARWRGAFGVHTWMATKRVGERRYTRLEVIGYRSYWGGDAVRVRTGVPDGMWFGNRPTLLREIRGGYQVDALIDTLHTAAQSYPYNHYYRVWPGPNSNTFIAHLARQVPQLRLELPATAIGKDYIPGEHLFSRTPSGVGVQVSARGYAGLLAGLEEGIELNLMGLTAGIDLLPPALKLPGIGRIGFSDTRRIFIGEAEQMTEQAD